MEGLDLKGIAALAAVLLSIIAMLIAWGRRSGVTESELATIKKDMTEQDNEIASFRVLRDGLEEKWRVRFDALYARFDLVERQTAERFERTQDKVNEALLTMAREHPTKKDLHELEGRIIGHIDMRFGQGRTTSLKA